MHAFSEVLTAPPAVEILHLNELNEAKQPSRGRSSGGIRDYQ